MLKGAGLPIGNLLVRSTTVCFGNLQKRDRSNNRRSAAQDYAKHKIDPQPWCFGWLSSGDSFLVKPKGREN